jgi:hypothetical protein
MLIRHLLELMNKASKDDNESRAPHHLLQAQQKKSTNKKNPQLVVIF